MTRDSRHDRPRFPSRVSTDEWAMRIAAAALLIVGLLAWA